MTYKLKADRQRHARAYWLKHKARIKARKVRQFKPTRRDPRSIKERIEEISIAYLG